MLLHSTYQMHEPPNLLYMNFSVDECELMLMNLNKPNELEISKYLDSLHFHVPKTYFHFLDPFAKAML